MRVAAFLLVQTRFPKEGMLYTQYPLPEALEQRLQALELELQVPIRAVVPRRGVIPDWSTSHLSAERATVGEYATDVMNARENGVTLALAHCPDGGYRWPVVFENGYTPSEPLQLPSDVVPPSPIYVEGKLIGDVEPRQVNDYMRLHSNSTWLLPDEMLDALENAIRLSIRPDFVEESDVARAAQQREALERYFRTTQDRQLVEKRAQIDELARLIIRRKSDIAGYVRSLQDAQQMLDAMIHVQQNASADTIVGEWDQLVAHPRVASATFAASLIRIITTDDLRLHHPRTGETRWLGAFEVTIDVSSTTISLKNLNTPRNGRDHPHVIDNEPCFGGHDSSFYELVGKGELFVVFELLLQYLENLNIHDEYGRYGAYWFDVPDERPLEIEEAVTA